MKKINLMQLSSIALFTSLFAFSSYIILPLSFVPITMQSLTIMLAGLILSKETATLSVGLWLLLGFFGIPVFAGGVGGPALLLSPRGGYLLGFILMIYLTTVLKNIPLIKQNTLMQRSISRTINLIPAMLSVYAIALPWLRWRTGLQPSSVNSETTALMTWTRTFIVGFWPFLLPDIIKTFLVAFTYESIIKKVISKNS